MEQWHYDPTADLNPAVVQRLREIPHAPDVLVRSLRSLAAVVVRAWLRVYNRLTIVGRDNLPVDRSFILIANHASHLDTLCMLAALPMARLHQTFPAAAKDYFCRTTLRTLLARVVINVLPFERYFAPWESLSVCAHLLEKENTILLLFPEGTRSGGKEPGEFKPGVALLAAGHNIPVVPCHIAGTHAVLPKGAWCPRPGAVRLTIGAPRLYAHLPATKEAARLICGELRNAVMALGNAEPETAAGRRVGLSQAQLTSGALP
ncbi:hypothetical protein AYO44_16155 [Planctomycetaceae bacterium SCGC AG-212-F19]|nr:hypothetical protein AYO44_16155 [Planctomycetaceae bacterium SCGC AG-212-F19]